MNPVPIWACVKVPNFTALKTHVYNLILLTDVPAQARVAESHLLGVTELDL